MRKATLKAITHFPTKLCESRRGILTRTFHVSKASKCGNWIYGDVETQHPVPLLSLSSPVQAEKKPQPNQEAHPAMQARPREYKEMKNRKPRMQNAKLKSEWLTLLFRVFHARFCVFRCLRTR
jgi:hypothetical protein